MNVNTKLVEALRRINFIEATEVQERTIPLAMEGKDIIARAKTGTGKTGAFLIPVLEKIKPLGKIEALIIAPTRELALQIYDFAEKLRNGTECRSIVVYGGTSIENQIRNLRSRPEIIIGTPGRIIDLHNRGAIDLNSLKFLILDEADTMLDMGFIDDIDYILSLTPKTRQTMLFSATMPQKIIDIAKAYMHNQSYIRVGEEAEITVDKIKHFYTIAEGGMKFATLLAYINNYNPEKAIIFCRTKNESNILHDFLKSQKFDAVLIHGGLTQAGRERSLNRFRSGSRFMIATNVAARGIDIRDISDIINFDVPEDPHVYVHRVGRTARMGGEGRAFTIIKHDERETIKDIEYIAHIRMEQVKLDISEYRSIRVFQNRDDSRRGFGGRSRFGGERRGGFSRDRGDHRNHGDRGRGRGGSYGSENNEQHGRSRDRRSFHRKRF